MPHCRTLLSFALALALCESLSALPPGQAPPASVQPGMQAPPPPTAVAATVNGKPIPELAVYRALGKRAEQSKQLREEALNYLIDNVLVDIYLDQMKIEVEGQAVDQEMEKVKAEIVQKGNKPQEVFAAMYLTESEFRTHIQAMLRWEKFIGMQATEKNLRDYFTANKAIFDGSSVRVKHILLSVPAGNAEATAQAKARIATLKKYLEDQVAQGMTTASKLDNLDLNMLRMKLLSEQFAALAAKESTCQTKSNGGELGWFPRSGGGRVPETFAAAAFTLKPWEMSNPVVTEVGVHLILCVEVKQGAEQRFEDMSSVVKDYYADKMREGVATMMRARVKIVINPTPQ